MIYAYEVDDSELRMNTHLMVETPSRSLAVECKPLCKDKKQIE